MIPTASRRQIIVGAAACAAVPAGFACGATVPAAASSRKSYSAGRFGQVHWRAVMPGNETTRHPIVCLHPTPFSGLIFERLLVALGPDRVAMAPDMPGYGDSDAPETKPTIDAYIDAVAADVAGAISGPFDMVGYGTGARLAIELALRDTTKVRSLVLIEPPLQPRADATAQQVFKTPKTISIAGRHLSQMWQACFAPASPDWPLYDFSRQFADTIRRPATSWWVDSIMADHDAAASLARVTQPVLILDPDDKLHAEGFSQDPGNAAFTRVSRPDWGFGFLDVNADASATLVRTFLDEAR
ncbi:MAG: alpha/beta hydrolase [Alphaproteobacteria bacterium]|nr:alpha/beta hydrolase [Alphaproteobacteria bacterium]